MTKADFLAGKPFKFGHSEYKYYDRDDKDYQTIDGGFVHKGEFVCLGYEVWINKIGIKGFEGRIS